MTEKMKPKRPNNDPALTAGPPAMTPADMAHLASFPENNPNPVIELDADGRVHYQNPAAAARFPDLPERGREHPFLVDWDALVAKITGEKLATFTRELYVGKRWYEQAVSYVPSIKKFRIYSRDITKRKEAELRVESVAKEWQTTFDSIADMVSIQDKDCHLIRVNKAYAAAAGARPEELIGQKCYAMLHHTGRPIENCPHEETMLTKNTVTREIYEPKLGIYLEVTTSPVFDESGEISGSVHIAKDITGRRRAEKALRDSQQDLNRAQAVAHTGSWRLDVRRDKLTWSDETYRIFGIPQGTDMTYETFLAAVHPEDREYVDGKWQAALRGEPYDIEHRIIAHGDIKWVSEKAELEFDQRRELLGGFGTVQDITALKKIDKMKDEFIGMVSHELRTPLTIVTGSLRTAMSAGLAAEEVRELIQNAAEGADQLAAILENMLELSRYQAGHLKLRLEPVSIAATVRAVIKKLVDQRATQSFTVDIPGDLPAAGADPVRVERIVYNLLENATKYSPEGSRITVSARAEGDYVVTAVADQGPGISPDDQARIFEQFQQLENRPRPSTGAGLGLVVCKRLVEAQKGWIKVDSEPGKGSVFSFALPRHA